MKISLEGGSETTNKDARPSPFTFPRKGNTATGRRRASLSGIYTEGLPGAEHRNATEWDYSQYGGSGVVRRGRGCVPARRGVLGLLRVLRGALLLQGHGKQKAPPRRGGGRQERRRQAHRRLGRPRTAVLPDHLLSPRLHGGGRRREEEGGVVPGDVPADLRGDVHPRHVGVLRAPDAAHLPVPVQAHPLEAPLAGGHLLLRGALQPPARGARVGDAGQHGRLPPLRHDAQDGALLLLLRHHQDRRRPLRTLAAVEPTAGALRQQQRVPRRPPPALRQQVQLLLHLLHHLGQAPRHLHALRRRREEGRRIRVQASDQGSVVSLSLSLVMCARQFHKAFHCVSGFVCEGGFTLLFVYSEAQIRGSMFCFC